MTVTLNSALLVFLVWTIRDGATAIPVCNSTACTLCLHLVGNGPRDNCFGTWLENIVQENPERTTDTLCTASTLVVKNAFDDCHWVAHKIGMAFALSQKFPQLSTYLTWDDLRARTLADVKVCKAVCLNGCKHAVISVYVREVVRRLNSGFSLTPEDYTHVLLNAIKERLNPFCPQDTEENTDETYTCYHGLGHGLLQPWGTSRIPLFTIVQARSICRSLKQSKLGNYACKTGVFMQHFRNKLDQLYFNNSGKTFNQLHSKIIALMRSVCNDDAGCGKTVGEVIAFEANNDKALAISFCDEAYINYPVRKSDCHFTVRDEENIGKAEQTLPTYCEYGDGCFGGLICVKNRSDRIGTTSSTTAPSDNTKITTTKSPTSPTSSTSPVFPISRSSTTTTTAVATVPESPRVSHNDNIHVIAQPILLDSKYTIATMIAGLFVCLCIAAVCGFRIQNRSTIKYVGIVQQNEDESDEFLSRDPCNDHGAIELSSKLKSSVI